MAKGGCTEASAWKQKAIALAQETNLSWREIAHSLNVPKSSVSDVLRQFFAQGGKKLDNSCILNISDLHAPYNHKDAIDFLAHLKDKYKPTRVILLGDECFPGDAEVLTVSGWLPLAQLDGSVQVLQYNEDGSSEFVTPTRKVEKLYSGEIIERCVGNYYSCTTAGHNIVLRGDDGKLHKIRADQINYAHYSIPRTTTLSGAGIPLTDNELRLFIAVSADFTLMKGYVARGSLTKQRKIDRLRDILHSLGAKFTETIQPSRKEAVHFYIAANQFKFLAKKYPHEWLSLATMRQRKLILEEMSWWDGHRDPARNRHIFCSSVPENIKFMQTMAHLAGVEASVRVVKSKFGDSQQVSVLYGKARTKNRCHVTKTLVEDLPVYCVTVPSGMLLVRQKHCITVSGNCDMHALSYHEKDPSLHSASHELEAAKKVIAKLYKLFPEADILESNHGSLVWRKAKTHGIPRQYIKGYNEVLGVGEGWKWHPDMMVILPSGEKVYYHHGKSADAIKVSQQYGCSYVCGHYHESFGIKYWSTPTGLHFAVNSGCLVDRKSLAFAYANNNMKRPIIGTSLIVDSHPVLEVMEL